MKEIGGGSQPLPPWFSLTHSKLSIAELLPKINQSINRNSQPLAPGFLSLLPIDLLAETKTPNTRLYTSVISSLKFCKTCLSSWKKSLKIPKG